MADSRHVTGTAVFLLTCYRLVLLFYLLMYSFNGEQLEQGGTYRELQLYRKVAGVSG